MIYIFWIMICLIAGFGVLAIFGDSMIEPIEAYTEYDGEFSEPIRNNENGYTND